MKVYILALLVMAFVLFGCPQQAQAPGYAPPAAPEPQPQASPQQPAPGPGPEPVSGPAAAIKEFKVLITHAGYAPDSFIVNKGDTVRFIAVAGPGQGWHGHGIAIDELGVNEVVRSEDESNPVVIEFRADKAGTFRIYCRTCNAPVGSWKANTGSDHPQIQATLEVK